jgi:hypothetical protein
LLAITSIGLDGEKLDQITYMPKPRIFLTEGMLAATATGTLLAWEAETKLCSHTGIFSALGEIVILQVTKAGNGLVAGPSTVTEMERLLQMFTSLGAKKILIDGAFSRQASSRLGDALVFVVGASYSFDMQKVVDHAKASVQKFALPASEDKYMGLREDSRITVFDDSDVPIQLKSNTALCDITELLGDCLNSVKHLYIPGAIGPLFVQSLIQHRQQIHFDLILQSPAALVVSGPVLTQLFLLKTKISVLHPMNLAAICYNPYSPSGHCFAEPEFRTSLESITSLPIYNVEGESEHLHE